VSVEGGGVAASGEAPGASTGRHRIAVAASGASLRVYLDRERVVSIPSIPQSDPATSLVLTISALGNRPRVAAVRLASGPAAVKTRLADGTLATYGVRFDPASDEVRPESAPVFREIASFLGSDATAKLSIRVQAEDVPEESRRSERAKKRAAAVRDVLVSQFGVPASRLVVGDESAAGKGNARGKRAGNAPVVFSRI
jgi:outer membrane protein OmpA-like peptidoglycan-associated protein